jgi:hypothetical protein
MYTYLLEHCGDGTTLLGAYESRPAAEKMLRELPQDEMYTVTEVPLNRRPGAGLADNMGSMNHWHYRGCVEVKGEMDEAPTSTTSCGTSPRSSRATPRTCS